MKPGIFTYHDPKSLEELRGCLSELDNFRLLAGGQSLMPMLNMRYAAPDHVIDINKIPDLSYLEVRGDRLETGATTRQKHIQNSDVVVKRFPIFREALAHVGHFQTRSRGTIGGSLCHLDPSAELPGLAALYDAELKVLGPNGTRAVAMNEWGAGYLTPILEPNEALIGLSMNAWPANHGFAFDELARRRGDFAIVGVACLLMVNDRAQIERAAISFVGIAYQPVRLRAAETALVGQPATPDTFAAAAAEVDKLDVIDDAHVTSDYRKTVAKVLLRRTLTKATERARQNAFSH